MKTQSNKVMLYALTSLVSLYTTANAMDANTPQQLQEQINKYVQILVNAPQVADYIENNDTDINKYTEANDRDSLTKLITAIESEKNKFRTEIKIDNGKGIKIPKKLPTLDETLNENSLTLEQIKEDLKEKKYDILDFNPEQIEFNDELHDLSYMIPKGTKVRVNVYKNGEVKSNEHTKEDAQLGKWSDEQIKEALQNKIKLGIEEEIINAIKTNNGDSNIDKPETLIKLYLEALNNDKNLKCLIINKALKATLTEDEITETAITADTTINDLNNEYKDKLLIPVSAEMKKNSGYADVIDAYNLELKTGVKSTVTGKKVTEILTENGIEGLLKLLDNSAVEMNQNKVELITEINKLLKTKIQTNKPFDEANKLIIKAIQKNMKQPQLKADPLIAQQAQEITRLKNELQQEKNKNKAKGGLKMDDTTVNEIIGILLGKVNKADADKIKKAYPMIDQIHPIYAPKNLK